VPGNQTAAPVAPPWSGTMSGRGPRPCSRRARRPGHSVLSGPDSPPERPATAILWWVEDRREAPARSPAGNRRRPQEHPLTMEQTLPPRQPRVVVWSCLWQGQAEVNRWPASGRDRAPEADPPSKPDHGEPGQPERGQASGRTTDSAQWSVPRRPEPQMSEPPRSEPRRPRAGRPARRRPAVPRRAAAPGPAMESRPPRQLEEPRLAIDLLQGRPSRAAVKAKSVPARRLVLEPPGDPRRGPACRRQRAVQRHWLAADSRATQGRRRPGRTHGSRNR